MRIFSIVAAIFLMSNLPAAAQTGPWDESFEFSKVRLVAAKETLDGSQQVQLGLEFDVAEGWNIYWRSPGPVGLPPTLTWTDQSNIRDSQIAWPVPSRYTYTIPGDAVGIESMIYRGNTVLPVQVEIHDPSQPLFARANVEYMVCDDQCIFGQANVSVDLFVGDRNAALSDNAAKISKFQSQVPANLLSGDASGLGLTAHSYDAQTQQLRFGVVSALPLSAPDVLVEAPESEGGFTFGAPTITLANDGLSALVVIPVVEVAYSGATPNDTPLRLTVVDGKRGLDLGFVQIGSDQAMTKASWALGLSAIGANGENGKSGESGGGFGPDGWSLLALVLAALAAGVILNFMPCVLPVLSLKLMAFVGKADQDNRQIRTSFLATAAGIVVSFWALAALVIALQQFGVAVGWGLQFQSPWFIGVMIAIMVVFAANMFGWFELPHIPGVGNLGANRKGPVGDFMTGGLATLLATPCSAPLLAPVIGIAFAGSPLTIFGLFSLIGVGMAAPYWLVVILPAIARIMPRPGVWMLVLKAILGVMLIGFALFLVGVLMSQLGAWVALVAVTLGGASLLLLFLARTRPAAVLPAIAAFLALSIIPPASASLLPNDRPDWLSPTPMADDIEWVAFDPDKIAELVNNGNTVFVDVTASWCVNCKFNKAIALDQAPVKRAFGSENLVAMVADWTNPNAQIANYLASFDRAGIPFNVVYSPQNPQGLVLPTVLTQKIVLDALDEAI